MGISGNQRGVNMDKFIKVLVKNNPNMEIECRNPECRKKIKIKSIDFFTSPNGVYQFVCPNCNKSSEIDNIDQYIADLKKKFKSLGITW